MGAMGDSIRNIERLEEDEDERRMPRGVAWVLVALGGGVILFAVLALGGRTSGQSARKNDPLGDLLAQRPRADASPGSAGSVSATDLSPRDVTFPQMLSDEDHPPTALAAVRQGASPGSAPASAPVAIRPPPPTDRLSVVPLPAQAVLEASPIVTHPRDALTRAASDAARKSEAAADAAHAGHEGGYQLQVSSFHTPGEAETFAEELRARGHKAYVVGADVPGRGTWYRVRIGPFPSQRAAADYRASFEEREHVVPFVVIPDARSH